MKKLSAIGITLALIATLFMVLPIQSLPLEWSDPQQLTTNLAGDYYPSIVQLFDEKILLVWNRVPPGDLVYKTSMDGGLTWSASDVLVLDVGYVSGTDVYQDSTGRIWVAWASGLGFEVYYITSEDEGGSWSTPQQLTSYFGNDYRPSLIEVSDEVWIVWARGEVWCRKTNNGGVSWSDPIQLTNGNSPDSFVDSGGKIWVSLNRAPSGPTSHNIYYLTSIDNGTSWSATQELTTHPAVEQMSSIIEDVSGRLFIFYDSVIEPEAPNLWFKATVDGGDIWSEHIELTSGGLNDQCPCAALINGEVWVVWHSLGRSESADIWMSRFSPLITWEYIFEDPCRGTELRISTDDHYFQFVAPDKEFPITQADKMKLCRNSFCIYHKDENIRLTAFGNTKLDFCIAFVKDMQTGQRYFLHDRADWCGWRTTKNSEHIVR